MKVTVLSTKWCSACPGLKANLQKLGIEYDDIDLEDNPSYAEGVTAVPVLIFPSGRKFIGSMNICMLKKVCKEESNFIDASAPIT